MSLDSKTTFLKISVVKSGVVTDLQLFFFSLRIYYWVFWVFFLVTVVSILQQKFDDIINQKGEK